MAAANQAVSQYRRAAQEEIAQRLSVLVAEQERRRASEVLLSYHPYPKQAAFHAAGATHRERLLRAGNQNGKTFCAGAEAAFHLTGLYPDWWIGRRFNHHITLWASSTIGIATRDSPQRTLLGRIGEYVEVEGEQLEMGGGLIPERLIKDSKPARGVSGLKDYVLVRHVDGYNSLLRFMYYAQGRENWQGAPVEVVWFDEEPPSDIYDEGLARTIATRGIVYLSFTPLLGMSNIVRRFLMESSPDRSDTNMSIEEAQHIPPEERARIIAAFPAHQREARARGIPTLGSGRIFPIAESEITFQLGTFPPHFVWIAGLDFGWDHPTAAVKCCWDRDADIFYVVATYRRSEQVPLVHAGALRPWGKGLPWAWPHDGMRHDNGVQLRVTYEEHGLAMLDSHATFTDGSVSVEAGVQQMLEAMQTGRFKVAAHLEDWFEEFRLYHREEGLIVKEFDDLMAATRYAWMMRRFAEPLGGHQWSPIDYPRRVVV